MNHRFRILNSALWLNSWLKLKALPGAGVAASGPCAGVGQVEALLAQVSLLLRNSVSVSTIGVLHGNAGK